MWKKQKKKRFFKSFICMVLAILLFVTNVPNLELVLKVMANPKPDRLTVEDKEEKAEHGSSDSEIKTETEITSLEKNTESAKENNLGQETGLGVTPMPDYVEMQSEPEQSADGMNMEETNHLNDNHSDYVKTVLPEDIVYDEIIEGDAILSDWIEIRDKKILYLGDVTINDFVKISNSTIRVSGQIILQSGGELQMENSTIWTDGDFRLTGGGIKGRQENVLVVMGGFYTQHSWDIPLGLTLELHGNFYHIEGSLNTKKSDWGQIVFAGEEEQHVSMGDGNLRNIVVSNREGKIHADTPLRGLELTHDTVIAGDEVVVTGNGNGYKLTIEGNFLGKGFNLNDSSHLYVQGEYRIQEIEGMEGVNYIPGIVSSGEAQIVVDKDFRIQKKDEDGNYGVTGEFLEPVISGSLRVVVKGDFYTQSVTVSNSISPEMTLEVYGDIHHVGNSYFRNKGLIVFAEKDEHHVSMGNSG